MPPSTPGKAGGWLYRLWHREYRLDRRLSIGILLAWMTMAALAWSACQWSSSAPKRYVEVLALAGMAIVGQLAIPNYPRLASVLAGMLVALILIVPQNTFWMPSGEWDYVQLGLDFGGMLLLSALLGYVAGVLATGIPLVGGELVQWLRVDVSAAHEEPATPWDDPDRS